MSNNIENAFLQFHSGSHDPAQLLNFPEGIRFGTLTINVATIPARKEDQLIYFTVDKSGSMNDRCGDGKTKLDHARETLVNMIDYFANLPDTNIHIQVDAFDDTHEVVIPAVRVSADNAEQLVQLANTLNHAGSTNIELALNCAKAGIQQYRAEHPDMKVTHVFMTDGDATCGLMHNNMLSNLICDDYANVFIGVGSHHNATMLQLFGEKKKAEYRFIDSGEKTGMVYGEILHRLIYNAIDDITIRMIGGEIYDWKSNIWKDEVSEDVFDSGIEKVYQVRSADPSSMMAEIHGRVLATGPVALLETVECLPELETIETGEHLSVDLSKYMFRQRVQEILFLCRKLFVQSGREFDQLRNNMKILFRKMREYSRSAGLVTDSFMSVLCDDIATAYRNMGTEHGRMYSGARQSSQGRQDAFTPRYQATEPHAPRRGYGGITRQNARGGYPFPPIPPTMSRQNTRAWSDISTQVEDWSYPETEAQVEETISEEPVPVEDNPDDLDQYVYGNLAAQQQGEDNFAYATPGRLRLMRAVTNGRAALL